MKKHSQKLDNFNTAMAAILRADPKAVKEVMEREAEQHAAERKAKGERKRGRKRAQTL